MTLILQHKKKHFILFASLGSHVKFLSATSLFSLSQEKRREKKLKICLTFALILVQRIAVARTLSSEEFISVKPESSCALISSSL